MQAPSAAAAWGTLIPSEWSERPTATSGNARMRCSIMRRLIASGGHGYLSVHCRIATSSLPARRQTSSASSTSDSEEVPVGLSDHSLGISVPQAAVALGACIVEKHYTVDKTLPGSPDHHLSVDPPEMKVMVAGIRTVEKALGKAQKALEPMERDAFLYARRSVTSAVAIPRGTPITAAMLTYKRPGTGINAKLLDVVVGRVAKVAIPADTTMTWEMV